MKPFSLAHSGQTLARFRLESLTLTTFLSKPTSNSFSTDLNAIWSRSEVGRFAIAANSEQAKFFNELGAFISANVQGSRRRISIRLAKTQQVSRQALRWMRGKVTS